MFVLCHYILIRQKSKIKGFATAFEKKKASLFVFVVLLSLFDVVIV